MLGKEDLMKFRYHVLIWLLVFYASFSGCSGNDGSGGQKAEIKLLVVHAGSLSIPFRDLSESFMRAYPEVRVLLESYGSRTAARQITDLKREVDVLGSADSEVIRQLLYPEYADFCIDFSTNEMVIVYTDESRFSNEISSSNWYEIILRDGVEFGHSDPNSDPCGYRSVLTMKLAEKYYNRAGLFKAFTGRTRMKNIRPKEVDLLAMIETGELDYLFIYRSVAEQHRLRYVSLPPQINLSSGEFAGLYAGVSIELTGKTPGETIRLQGEPMVYGITIPKSSANRAWAVKFLRFLFSGTGREIMSRNGQPLLEHPAADHPEALPESIREDLGI
jgi:molybdate/tungstate transport system substrate-binding protein